MARGLQAFLIIAASATGAGECQSPRDKGVWIIGGNARITGLKDLANDSHEFGFELSPQVGWFVTKGLALTANAQFGWSTREQSGSWATWGAGPGLSYYFSGRRVLPYVSVRTLAAWMAFTPSGDLPQGEPIDDTLWNVTGSVGVALFLARNVAINGEVFYSYQRISETIGTSGDSSSNASILYGIVRIAVWRPGVRLLSRNRGRRPDGSNSSAAYPLAPLRHGYSASCGTSGNHPLTSVFIR